MKGVALAALHVAVTVLCARPSSAHAETLVVGRDATTVQQAVDAAREGDVVLVPAGVYREHVRISRQITLRGEGATLDGGGEGTVIVVAAPRAVVEGFTVRGSGPDVGVPDCCIYTEPSATGAVVRDNRMEDCAFGIWVHRSDHARILGNRIRGRSTVRVADRGNGIQLFDASFLAVEGNSVVGARDGIYVSACEDSVFADNQVRDQRYGFHYMYSHRNTLRNNHATGNLGGFALMESRELSVVGNVATDNRRYGLLFRDAQDCVIRGNLLERNGEGMFFFSSTRNDISYNRLIHNDVGAKVWAGSIDNRVQGNQFIGNRQQVFYVGTADLEWGADGTGNLWSDYSGWDQDGDGIGDRPYRVDSFTANLLYTHPGAALLMSSPILELLAHLESRMPLFRVPTVIDLAPLMAAPPTGEAQE